MKQSVTELLNGHGWSYRLRGQEAVGKCPACGHEDFAVNVDTGQHNCLRASCNIRGGMVALRRLFGEPDPIAYEPKAYTKPKPAGADPADKVLHWFRDERGISASTLVRFGIREHNGAIVFPYYRDGQLVAQKYRGPGKKFWTDKGGAPALFGRDLVPPEVEEIIITEGEIDAMSAAQLGFANVVSVPSGASNLDWIDFEWDWLQRFPTIFLALDMDEPGESAARKAAQRLGIWRCRRVLMPHKDMNAWLKAGATAEDITKALIGARAWAPKGVKLAEDFGAQILADDPKGLDIGFREYDRLMLGQRPGEVTVVTGRNGDGKTTWLNQVVLNLLRTYPDQRVHVISLEMRPSRLLRWLMYQAGIVVSESGLEEFWRFTEGRLSLLDLQEEVRPDELFEAMEYVARRLGATTFVVDSLMRIDIGGGAEWLEAQKAFVNRLKGFAMEHGAHVYLVAHPRKGSSDGARIEKVDVAGSGDVGNICDNMICIRRQQSGAVVEILKNRTHGKLGAIAMRFDESRKLFSEA